LLGPSEKEIDDECISVVLFCRNVVMGVAVITASLEYAIISIDSIVAAMVIHVYYMYSLNLYVAVTAPYMCSKVLYYTYDSLYSFLTK